MTKRQIQRRSEDERIAELRAKIDQLKQRVELKQRRDGPVYKEMKKVRRVLLGFCNIANDCDRPEVSTMTEAFLAGLERQVGLPSDEFKRRGRGPKNPMLAAG